MPSGKTHDAITLVLAFPVLAAGYAATADIMLAATATASFMFGGLMFGPDLDTRSTQYSRWGPLRLIWFPYRTALKHRSRWSHGLTFGTLFRVVYFMGVITLAVYLVLVAIAAISGGEGPSLSLFARSWQQLGSHVRGGNGQFFVIAVFAGMWAGAASHTFTDIAGTYIKTGRVDEFL